MKKKFGRENNLIIAVKYEASGVKITFTSTHTKFMGIE